MKAIASGCCCRNLTNHVLAAALAVALVAADQGLASLRQESGQVLATRNPIAFSTRQPSFSAELAGVHASGELFLATAPEGAADASADQPAPQALRIRYEQSSGSSLRWKGSGELPRPRVRVEVEISERGSWAGVSVKVQNRSRERLLLELGWRARVDLREPEYWGGMSVRPRGRACATRPRFAYPLATLADDRACLAIGYEPSQWLSYIANSADMTHSPTVLQTSTRIVVDGGASQAVSFVIGLFAGPWKHLEALHRYYEAFPRWFRPLPQVDPRVSLNGGSYLVWRAAPRCDLARRLQVGWDWCYAPFRRTGDIYGRRELWDYTPARTMAKFRAVPIDKFHAERRKRFSYGRLCDTVMAFYIPSQVWCEEQLARSRYADALTTDPTVKTYFDTPWVTGHDNELRVFPFNTNFGRQSRLDMARVVRELNLEAFAFDTANGGARYYGPAVDSCPGRAWDERGVYVDEAVAIGKLMDWVHAQKSNGHRLAVIANPGAYGSYMSVFRCDSSMLESSPAYVHSRIADGLRYRLGHKTMVFWETYDYEALLRHDLTREQYEDALRGMADWTVLACLREAALPTPRIAMGLGPLVRWLPILRDMALAGWEPVPAAVAPQGMWTSRAGRDLNCYIATGNETARDITGELLIDDERIGGGRYLWRRVAPDEADGAPVQCLVGATTTRVPIRLRPREPLVLKTAAALSDAPAGLSATLSMRRDAHRAVLSVRFTGATGKCRIRLAQVPDMKLVAITLGRQAVRLPPGEATSNIPLSLSPPCTLHATYVSNTFAVSKTDLCAFPKLAGDRMNFAVVLGKGVTKQARAVRWLSEYFPTYHRHAVTPRRKVQPPLVVADSAAQVGRQLRLIVDPSLPQDRAVTMPAPDRLVVAARNMKELERAVKLLLAVWDEKFFYPGPLPGLEMFKRVGLAGKAIM